MTALAMILAAADQHAQRIAIEDADGRGVTYAELIARARRRARNVAAGSVVELPALRSVDFVVGCLAAWLAGAAWMPVDPGEPARTDLTSGALVEPPADLAYVIPTSGSSGVAKRVMVGHRGLPALLRAQIAAFELSPGARSLWLHAPRFDASVSDWGTALAAGATLVIPSPAALVAADRLRSELVRRQISHVDLPPSLLAHLPPDDPPPRLCVVVLGGEPCPIEPLRALARRTRVVVVYGPTEATVCSSLVVVDPARWSRPLIGDPLPGVVYRVVDGELWIGGDCLALGYAGDAQATARAFVEQDGRRMYRTGDRVEACDGGLAFVGRLDRQRKIAGVRIELGEVEARILRLPRVRAAAVTTASSGGRTRLVAFVEPEAEHRLDAVSIRAQLSREAPPHLVPSRVVIGALPRTPTGKVDHAALAGLAVLPPETDRVQEIDGASVGDPLARELARLWCEATGAEAVTGERFRVAGGDSLAQLTLQAAAAARGLPLDPAVFAGDPTFVELVGAVRGTRAPAITVEQCETRGSIALVKMTASEPLLRRSSLERQAGAGAVLITGATGRLGGALLRAWRARDARPIIALVRAPDISTARRRLAIEGAEIDVVCGDVARPYFGINEPAWCSLASRVSAVVHGAARLDLAAGWDAHASANVDGTVEIARLVAAAPWIAWHHVSTLSVFVGTDRATGRHGEADEPADEAIVHGGYAQTKIAAEAIARGARGRVAATTILRLGLLAGASSDQLAMTLRGLTKLAAIPAGAAELRLDITPIDHAAAAVVALALRAERDQLDDTHHVASARGASFGELCDALRASGIRLDELAPAAWADLARSRLADPEIAMAYVSLGRAIPGGAPASFDLFLATGADFDVARTTQLLADRGIAAPRIDQALLTALCRAALEDAS